MQTWSRIFFFYKIVELFLFGFFQAYNTQAQTYIKHPPPSASNQPRWKWERERESERNSASKHNVYLDFTNAVLTTFMVNGKTFPIFGWVLCNWRMEKFNSSSSSILTVTTHSFFPRSHLYMSSLVLILPGRYLFTCSSV